MPLDGLSFSNSGLYRVATPNEIAVQAEQVAKVQAETFIKEVEEQEKIKSDLEDNYEGHGDLEGRETGDDFAEQDQHDDDFFESEKDGRKFKIRFNKTSDMIELIDHNTGLVAETVTPAEFVNLISKSKGFSGILVDKEI